MKTLVLPLIGMTLLGLFLGGLFMDIAFPPPHFSPAEGIMVIIGGIVCPFLYAVSAFAFATRKTKQGAAEGGQRGNVGLFAAISLLGSIVVLAIIAGLFKNA